MDTEEQLRSTSDQVLGTIERLRVLEVEKRGLPPTSRRFHKLAREVEQLADSLARRAGAQAELGEQLATKHAQAGKSGTPIVDIERDVTTILGEWRDAERRAAAAPVGSTDKTQARADVDRLRAEYQRAHQTVTRRDEGNE
jgi:hypothetical protein